MEGLDPESVMAFAGSSEPLHYTVLDLYRQEQAAGGRRPRLRSAHVGREDCRR